MNTDTTPERSSRRAIQTWLALVIMFMLAVAGAAYDAYGPLALGGGNVSFFLGRAFSALILPIVVFLPWRWIQARRNVITNTPVVVAVALLVVLWLAAHYGDMAPAR